MKKGHIILIAVWIIGCMVFFQSCKEDDCPPDRNYNPTAYELVIPFRFPEMTIPEDNPMTVEGVELGRKLFYDPILSGDSSLACAGCHLQKDAFTDIRKFSEGIDGNLGNRNAMQIINLGWADELFWDGRSSSLEHQALQPVENPVEMHETWENAVGKLRRHAAYPDLFFDAFGTEALTKEHVAKAIAQFERTLISSNSKFDRFLRGEENLSEQEFRGFDIFNTEKGDCFHCHGGIFFTDFDFHNNGLDSVFTDLGLAEFTMQAADEGKFKAPTLRNIALTPPYMHDGRFADLRAVIDFYNEGLQRSATIDPLMKKIDQGGLLLTESEKDDLLSFLLTLTDTTFVNNAAFSNPFQ